MENGEEVAASIVLDKGGAARGWKVMISLHSAEPPKDSLEKLPVAESGRKLRLKDSSRVTTGVVAQHRRSFDCIK